MNPPNRQKGEGQVQATKNPIPTALFLLFMETEKSQRREGAGVDHSLACSLSTYGECISQQNRWLRLLSYSLVISASKIGIPALISRKKNITWPSTGGTVPVLYISRGNDFSFFKKSLFGSMYVFNVKNLFVPPVSFFPILLTLSMTTGFSHMNLEASSSALW